MKNRYLINALVLVCVLLFATGCSDGGITAEPVEEISISNKTVSFFTLDINKKYFNDIKGFVELKLKLPRLDGKSPIKRGKNSDTRIINNKYYYVNITLYSM